MAHTLVTTNEGSPNVIVRCMSVRWKITLLSRLGRTVVKTHELLSNGVTHTRERDVTTTNTNTTALLS